MQEIGPRNSSFKQDLLLREIKGLEGNCARLAKELSEIESVDVSTSTKSVHSTNQEETINSESVQSKKGGLPTRFQTPPSWPIPYQHSLYSTTSSQYGSQQPTAYEMPKVFYGMSTKFSKKLTVTYRNFGLNS